MSTPATDLPDAGPGSAPSDSGHASTAHPATRPSRRTLLAAGVPAVAALGLVGALGSARPANLGEVTGDRTLAEALRPHLGGHRTVAVVLVDGDRTRFAGFGADEHREFEIGSVSKTFTAALIMDAVAAGRIALTDTVADVLGTPAARSSATGKATVRQLVTHTSGLPSLPPSIGLRNLWTTPLRKNPYAGISGADVITGALDAKLTDIGTHAYSNLGVSLEGQLVAHAQSSTWQELLRTRLIEPLKLTATRAPRTEAELGASAPRGHVPDGHRCAAWVQDGIAPAGGIRSTAADMTRYLRSMMDGSNPGAQGLKPLADAGDGQKVAVNWFLQDLPHAGPIIWHNGRTGGFASFVGWVPKTSRGVVLMSDTSTGLDELAARVLDGQVA